MKRSVRTHARATYIGVNNTRAYPHALELCDVLGQGDTVIVEIFGHRKDADAKVKVEAFANNVPGTRPHEVGQLVKVIDPGTGNPVNSVELTTLRPAHVHIEGPFPARLEILLTVDTADSGATPTPEFDFEAWATVIIGD